MSEKSNYYSAQEILRRCFINKTNTLKSNNYTLQDYLNAVYDDTKDALRIGGGGGGDSSTSQDSWVMEHLEALTYLVEHMNDIKDMLESGGTAGETTIVSKQFVFDTSNAELMDSSDSDMDDNTYYVFKVDGYVLFTGTYESENSPFPDKYLAKMVYRENEGKFGTTYIYFEKDSFEYFAGLDSPRNILQLYILKPKITN